MEFLTTFRLGIAAFAVLVAVSLVTALTRYRDRASARPLFGVGVTVTVGTVLHLLVADLTPPNAALAVTGWDLESTAWVVIGTTVGVIAGGLWVLFAFRYTGRSQRVIQVTAAVVAGISLGAVSLAAVALGNPSTIAFQLLTVTYLLVGFLVTIGVFLLLWTSVGQQATTFREPMLLSAGAIVLLSGSFVAQIFERPLLLPALTSISGGLFLVAVEHYPVFETPPAARVLGRDRVVEELADGVLVVDRRGRLRDLNPAAERLLDVSTESTLGEPLGSIFPTAVDPEELASEEGTLRIELQEGTMLSVTVDPVTDRRDRSFGYLVRCRNVTDRRRREEQLTLLSRFVVEVIRERMGEVADEVSTQAAELTDARTVADRTWKRTTELTTLVARTRSIERTIAADGVHASERLEPRSLVRDLRDSMATESGPQIATDITAGPIDTTISPALLGSLLEPVFEDACAHAATQVEVDVISDGPTIRIVDDRPAGTDRNEQGRDADLALAVTRLALEQLDGDLSVRKTGDERRAVIVALPTNDARGEERAVCTGGDDR